MKTGKQKKRWPRRLGTLVLILVAGYFIMGLFYRLPDISSREQSYMIDDGEATSLGRQFGPQVADNPGRTAVFLLPRGRDAFAARALLARKSEKSLDIQYYMYHQDTVGGLLTYEVLRAADRGVRVRMLIDDIYGNQDEDTWVGLDAHENIEVRMWNPWKRGRSRLLQSLVRAAAIDYRMHAKSFTADNQATILGGRNIGNEYFDADPDVAFTDIDVLSIGPPVREVSTEFDSYWNAEHAFPVNILVRQGTDQDVADLRSKKNAFYKKQATSDYVEALTDSDLAKGLKDGSLAFTWADERVIHCDVQAEPGRRRGAYPHQLSGIERCVGSARRLCQIPAQTAALRCSAVRAGRDPERPRVQDVHLAAGPGQVQPACQDHGVRRGDHVRRLVQFRRTISPHQQRDRTPVSRSGSSR